jgi:hypothetical protein
MGKSQNKRDYRTQDFGFTPERLTSVLERRSSGASGAHDSRPHRQRSRRDAVRAAIRDSGRG